MEDPQLTRRLEAVAIAMLAFPLLNGLFLPFLIYRPVFFWIVDTLQWVIVTGICWYYLFGKWNYSSTLFGISWPATRRDTLSLTGHSAMCAVLFVWIYATLNSLCSLIFPYDTYPPSFTFQWVMPEAGPWKIVTGIYGSVGAGIVEEFLYRGLLVALFRRYGMSHAMMLLIVSSIFSLAHWETGLANIPATFLLSLLITAYYLKTNLLLPLIIGHTICDLVYFLAAPITWKYWRWIWNCFYA